LRQSDDTRANGSPTVRLDMLQKLPTMEEEQRRNKGPFLFLFFFNSWGNKAIQDERVTTFVCSKGVDKESSDKVRLFEYQK
jgi:hypothetical protein